MGYTEYLDQGVADFFYKGPDSTHLQLGEPRSLPQLIPLPLQHQGRLRQRGRAWLCSSKFAFHTILDFI